MVSGPGFDMLMGPRDCSKATRLQLWHDRNSDSRQLEAFSSSLTLQGFLDVLYRVVVNSHTYTICFHDVYAVNCFVYELCTAYNCPVGTHSHLILAVKY